METLEARRLRIGIIGAGRIVERAHLPILTTLDNLSVESIFDPDQDRASAIAAQFSIPHVCGDLDALLSRDLDVALVACPNHLHARMSVAALEAGLHVFCEKPMATSLVDAETMVAAARRSRRELMIGFTNRFRPEIQGLAAAIQQGTLGEIRAIRAGWLRRGGVPGAGTWFTEQSASGGGALIDLGSHLIDLALWLGAPGELRTATCALDYTFDPAADAGWYTANSSAPSQSNVEISASGFLTFRRSLNLFVEVSWSSSVPHDQTYLTVLGTQGIARLNTLFGFSPLGVRPEYPLDLYRDGEPVLPKIAGASDLLQPYRQQWQFFCDTLRSGCSLADSLDQNLLTMQAIDALYAAGRQNLEL